mmetsp:Transcript_5152/g.23755  ORF Transcript_5152/g.23755 Transcript_5152/m.23755 type:complete len:203 (-) Transcript_5152:1238-1846(-)
MPEPSRPSTPPSTREGARRPGRFAAPAPRTWSETFRCFGTESTSRSRSPRRGILARRSPSRRGNPGFWKPENPPRGNRRLAPRRWRTATRWRRRTPARSRRRGRATTRASSLRRSSSWEISRLRPGTRERRRRTGARASIKSPDATARSPPRARPRCPETRRRASEGTACGGACGARKPRRGSRRSDRSDARPPSAHPPSTR